MRSFHHSRYPVERLIFERRSTVSVVVPTRECAHSIGAIARTLVGLWERGAIDQVIVVDAASADGTAAIAARQGATVVDQNSLLREFGPVLGKGDAMWRALSLCHGDVVCFLDGDSGHFGRHFAAGTLGPVLFEPGVEFSKAFFRRPFRSGMDVLPSDGGRVTELTARPLLRRFWPELGDVKQPLAGEMAARRDLLCALPWSTGYAVETALLLDVHREVGIDRMAQVDLDVRQNVHKPLAALGPMADEVLAAAMTRLEREGRLAYDLGGLEIVERPPLSKVLRLAA